jgi:hypothetical protein
MLVSICQITGRHIPEDSNLNADFPGHLRSQTDTLLLAEWAEKVALPFHNIFIVSLKIFRISNTT